MLPIRPAFIALLLASCASQKAGEDAGAQHDPPTSADPAHGEVSADAPTESLPQLIDNVADMSPDHRLLAIATKSAGVWVIDIHTRTVIHRFPARGSTLLYIRWSSDGSLIAIVDSGRVEVRDGKTGVVRASFPTGLREPYWYDQTPLAFVSGDSVLLVAGPENVVDLWPSTGGERIAQLSMRTGSRITALAYSTDGRRVALGTDQGQVRVWEVDRPDVVVDEHDIPSIYASQRVNSLAFSPSGDVLAVGGGDCVARTFVIGSMLPYSEYSHCAADWLKHNRIGCVQFSPDGSRLLSTACHNGWALMVWSIASGKCVGWYDYGGGSPRPLLARFSSDGRVVGMDIGCLVVEPSRAGSSAELAPLAFTDYGHLGFRFRDDYAWAVVDRQLVVRTFTDDLPSLKLPVRDK